MHRQENTGSHSKRFVLTANCISLCTTGEHVNDSISGQAANRLTPALTAILDLFMYGGYNIIHLYCPGAHGAGTGKGPAWNGNMVNRWADAAEQEPVRFQRNSQSGKAIPLYHGKAETHQSIRCRMPVPYARCRMPTPVGDDPHRPVQSRGTSALRAGAAQAVGGVSRTALREGIKALAAHSIQPRSHSMGTGRPSQIPITPPGTEILPRGRRPGAATLSRGINLPDKH